MEFWVGIGLLERVPNQSCYGYHQISHEGDAMEISVIAPYASGYEEPPNPLIFSLYLGFHRHVVVRLLILCSIEVTN